MGTDKNTSREIANNEVLLKINLRFRKQVEKGLEKYGETVSPDNLTTIEWIDHAQEELMDAMVYLEVLKEKLTPHILGQEE